jgi:NAD(P)-dependent dehydrogenase (short-subunit alcohol dehydrogenase family)
MAERIVTPFSSSSTAAEVVEGIDLTGKCAVVTGGASGIGVETARALAGAGAAVTIAARNLAAAEAVAADIAATTGNQVEVGFLDLTDVHSARAFATGWTGPLHMLVNNAGVMAAPETRVGPDWEMQFATNHLGHAALTIGLHDALATAGNARVVSLTSTGHMFSDIVWDDIHFANRPYEPWSAYGQSKTANILFAVGITSRWAADGITANACHPGSIQTNLQRHVDQEAMTALRSALADGGTYEFKTPEQGAATSVLLATSPRLEGIGARYFEDCNESAPNVPGERSGYAWYALDSQSAERLWGLTEEMLASVS